MTSVMPQQPEKRTPNFSKMGHHDFADLVLYVLPDDENSQKALKLSSRINGVHVQSVSDLPRPLPVWLTGIPTLVKKSEQRAYRGSACLEHLTQESTESWSGAQEGTSYIGGFADGAAMSCGPMVHIHDLDNGEVPAGTQQQQPHSAREERPGRIDQSDVEAYMRARGEE
jgi:hypothetical protein